MADSSESGLYKGPSVNAENGLLATPFPISSAHKESALQALNLPRVAHKRSQRIRSSTRARSQFKGKAETPAQRAHRGKDVW